MKNIIDEIDNSILDDIMMEDYEMIDNLEYQGYFKAPSSKEHYRLLTHISNKFDDSIFIDIGTLKGSSALALSKNKTNTVYSFNLREELQLKQKPENVKFIVDHVMNPEYTEILLKSKLILLDTFHDGTFENTFYDYLKNINYQGVLLLDDIKLNNAMITFWNSIDKQKFDISSIGHITGTGIVYFN